MLRAADHLGLDPRLAQARTGRLEHVVDVELAFATALLDETRDLAIGPLVERLEREVLELPLHLLDAEPMRERRVDLEGGVRDALLLVRRQGRERSHVVQAVGELDEQDADVAGHRDDHLANVLRLLVLAGAELHLVELREPVHDPGDLPAEPVLQLLDRHGRVLDGVVQERGLQGGRVEPEVGEDPGDRERVFDERLARQPLLALVVFLREPVGALDLLQVRLRVVGLHGPKQPVETLSGGAGSPGRRRESSPPRRSVRSCSPVSIRAVTPVEPVYAGVPRRPYTRRPLSTRSA